MLHKVFVYGSLLSGHSNNYLLLKDKKVGDFSSIKEYTMVSFGGFPAITEDAITNVPQLSIKGEVWEVTDETLSDLDILEGNGRFYQRHKTKIKGLDEEVWCYVIVESKHISHLPPAPIDNGFYDWSLIRKKIKNEKKQENLHRFQNVNGATA